MAVNFTNKIIVRRKSEEVWLEQDTDSEYLRAFGRFAAFVRHLAMLVGQPRAFVGHFEEFVGNLPVGWTLCGFG